MGILNFLADAFSGEKSEEEEKAECERTFFEHRLENEPKWDRQCGSMSHGGCASGPDRDVD
tara:strand:+ start:201 stop:383 length:183 start_codon:yes stop_codon:yes gene_type:complete